MYICPPDLLCLLHPIWIVIWKPGCPCVALWLCPNHLISVSTPWLEICTCISTCIHVHLTYHVYSTLLSQSPHFWSHTLVRMFTCISICVYVHLAPHVCFTPCASSHGNMCPVWQYVCIPVTLLLVPHLGKNVYMHQYMYICLPNSPYLLNPISIFAWKHGFLCVTLHVCSSHSTSVPTQ